MMITANPNAAKMESQSGSFLLGRLLRCALTAIFLGMLIGGCFPLDLVGLSPSQQGGAHVSNNDGTGSADDSLTARPADEAATTGYGNRELRRDGDLNVRSVVDAQGLSSNKRGCAGTDVVEMPPKKQHHGNRSEHYAPTGFHGRNCNTV